MTARDENERRRGLLMVRRVDGGLRLLRVFDLSVTADPNDRQPWRVRACALADSLADRIFTRPLLHGKSRIYDRDRSLGSAVREIKIASAQNGCPNGF